MQESRHSSNKFKELVDFRLFFGFNLLVIDEAFAFRDFRNLPLTHFFLKNITPYSCIGRFNGRQTARCRPPVDSLQLTISACFTHSKKSSVGHDAH